MSATTIGPNTTFTLRADEGRTAVPLNVVGEETLMKVGPQDSAGRLAVFHLVAPPMSGPPRHVHSREDEWFYVLEGELEFEIDGVRSILGAGDSIWLRAGVGHAYQNFRSRDARLLIATTPGEFAGFFEEISAATPAGGMPSIEILESLHTKYGITTLGPPMGR